MKSYCLATVATALVTAAWLFAASMTYANPATITDIQAADMDTSVRPQDDLFAYANGTWLRDVPIPPDRSSYGVDSLMTERSLLQQRELIEAAQNTTDPEARKVSDLYDSYMNAARVERLGTKPLQADLLGITLIRHANQIGPMMAHLDHIGIPSPIATTIRPDSKHSTQYAFWLTQSGLGLPDRDYYLSDDARLTGFRSKYHEHIEKMLHLLGERKSAEQEDFAFNQGILQGTQQEQERWKRGTQLVDRLIGEASGKMYVAKYFPPATKARIDELVRNLIKAYASRIDQLQ